MKALLSTDPFSKLLKEPGLGHTDFSQKPGTPLLDSQMSGRDASVWTWTSTPMGDAEISSRA